MEGSSFPQEYVDVFGTWIVDRLLDSTNPIYRLFYYVTCKAAALLVV
jgi:hypothetical protein